MPNVKNFEDFIKEHYQLNLFPEQYSETNVLDQFIKYYTTSKKKNISNAYNNFISVYNLFQQKDKLITDDAIKSILDHDEFFIKDKVVKYDMLYKFVSTFNEKERESFLEEIKKFEGKDIQISFLRNIFPDFYIFDLFNFINKDEELLNDFLKISTHFNQLKNWVIKNKDNNKLEIFRAVKLDRKQNKLNKQSIRYEGVGQSWTYNYEKAIPYFADFKNEDVDFILIAKADWSDIDWEKTMERSVYVYSKELEIFVKNDSTLEISEAYTDINDDIKRTIDKNSHIQWTTDNSEKRVKLRLDGSYYVKIGNSE